MISTLRRGLLVLLAALPLMANAAAGGSAHDLVQDTTNKMLADLSANKEKYKQDPSQFYNALKDALMEMTLKRLGMTVILESDGRLAGVFTDGDLRRTLDRNLDIQTATIDEVMTPHGKTARPDMLAAEALKIMEDHKILALVVVDSDDRPVGALNMHDLLRAGVM